MLVQMLNEDLKKVPVVIGERIVILAFWQIEPQILPVIGYFRPEQPSVFPVFGGVSKSTVVFLPSIYFPFRLFLVDQLFEVVQKPLRVTALKSQHIGYLFDG